MWNKIYKNHVCDSSHPCTIIQLIIGSYWSITPDDLISLCKIIVLIILIFNICIHVVWFVCSTSHEWSNPDLPADAFLKSFFFAACFVHSVHASLMPPSEQTGRINVGMCVIFIIRYLSENNQCCVGGGNNIYNTSSGCCFEGDLVFYYQASVPITLGRRV